MSQKATYLPHPAQVAIHRAKVKRFRIVCTGRRFGKTFCLAGELLDWARRVGGEYGWVAPTYNVAERGIEAFRACGADFVQVCGRAPCRVQLPPIKNVPPTRVWFLSADNPDSIRGFGFRGLVIDEAASIPQDVWHYVLRPTISQTLGWAVFVSTPKGRNWFYDLFTRGQDPAETDYASFTFPSKASPFFPAKEWEEAKRTLPEDVFRQEYMAEFLEDSAGVFRGIDACLTTDGGGCDARQVVIGCDIAKHTDWTVLIAMDVASGRCLAMERFNQLDWPIQKERIVTFARKWRGRVILDGTGIGDPIYDDLKRVLSGIEAFKLTPGSKVELVQRLIVAVEQRQVCWPGGAGIVTGAGGSGRVADRGAQVARDTGPSAALSRDGATARLAPPTPPCGQGGLTRSFAPETPIRDTVRTGADTRRFEISQWDILTAEMKRFEYAIGPTGTISYSAPAGYHDDCVMALALANHGRWEAGGCGQMARVTGGGERGHEARGRFARRSSVLMGV